MASMDEAEGRERRRQEYLASARGEPMTWTCLCCGKVERSGPAPEHEQPWAFQKEIGPDGVERKVGDICRACVLRD